MSLFSLQNILSSSVRASHVVRSRAFQARTLFTRAPRRTTAKTLPNAYGVNVPETHSWSGLTGRRCYSQMQEDRAAVGVFTPLSAGLFVAAGVGLYFYFRYEKANMLEQREKERAGSQHGRAHIGGAFNLKRADKDEEYTEKDLLGQWSLLYFGFTNCPDICPTELDKMGSILDVIEKEHGQIFQPIFISVDPARDTPARLKQYLAEFHPRFIGLVGSYLDTKAVCRMYRVYFSTPPGTKENDDYLVDHSIFVYLMDPEGQFVEAFGQSVEAPEVIEKVREAVKEWTQKTGKKV